MKTAQFPTVLEARQVVINQMTFYKSVMSDKKPAKAKSTLAPKSSLRKVAATARKKSVKKVSEECSA
jgi:hypothetical protein